MSKLFKIIFFSILAILLVGGVAIYLTFYSSKSKADFLYCKDNSICRYNQDCGSGKCQMLVDSISIGGGKASRIARVNIGRCVCDKPTPTPTVTSNPTVSPMIIGKWWWYDSSNLECKSTAPLTTASGLKTFSTLKECEIDLFSRNPTVAKVNCQKRNGVEYSSKGYQFGFNISKSTACWTPILDCGWCNGQCVNVSTDKCGDMMAAKAEVKSCVDVLGRCTTDDSSSLICPQPASPPLGCRVIETQTIDGQGKCPSYRVICETSPVPSIPIPTPSAMTSKEYCSSNGGSWRTFFTENGEEGWCIKGIRGCEGLAYSSGKCSL